MRSYLPKLGLAPPRSSGLRAKFGGLPWGLPPERWPLCRQCGEPMSLLAQIPVRGHLDHADCLRGPARSDKVLHLFTCEQEESACSMYELEAGANAAFFLAERDLLATETQPPLPEPPLCPEVWIVDWVPHDDPIPDALAGEFADPLRFYALPEALQFPHEFASELRTKLGGVPYWTGNGPGRHPDAPYKYLLQIDIFLHVPGADRGYLELANFCATGTGYVYVDADRADLPSLFAINR